jgi:N-acetyl-gamma-glutamyl-phosphate reductase
MQTTIYAQANKGVACGDVEECFKDFYKGRPFVRICGGVPADSLNVKGTNCCDIGFFLDAPKGQLILTSAIDNLVKGAAGQAVQNMNIMMGMDEAAGLMGPAYPI